MRLREFIEQTGKKFICLEFSYQTQQNLTKWATEAGFNLSKDYNGNPVSDFGFHVTVICSNNGPSAPLPNGEMWLQNPIDFVPLNFQVLGIDRQIPVLVLTKTPGLLKIRQQFQDLYGLTDKFPDYKPHVSLSYAWNGSPKLTQVRLPNFPLTVDKIKIEDSNV